MGGDAGHLVGFNVDVAGPTAAVAAALALIENSGRRRRHVVLEGMKGKNRLRARQKSAREIEVDDC